MKHLFIINKAPYRNDQVKESMDMAMALAAFDSEVSVLFTGLGVWNINREQHPKSQGLREFTRLFKGLSLYDIKNIYVDKSALEKEQLELDDLFIEPQLVENDKIKHLIDKHHRIYCL